MTNPPPETPVDPKKPGWKTTEFYLSTLALIVGVLFASDLFALDSPVMRVLGLVSSILAALGYTWSRTSTKNTVTRASGGFISMRLLAVIAIVGASSWGIVACTWLQHEAKTAARSAVKCTEGAARQAALELGPTFDVVLTQAVRPDGRLDAGPLKELAARATSTLGQCVIADAFARLVSLVHDDPDAPKAAPLNVDRDAARATFRALSNELYGGAVYQTSHGEI